MPPLFPKRTHQSVHTHACQCCCGLPVSAAVVCSSEPSLICQRGKKRSPRVLWRRTHHIIGHIYSTGTGWALLCWATEWWWWWWGLTGLGKGIYLSVSLSSEGQEKAGRCVRSSTPEFGVEGRTLEPRLPNTHTPREREREREKADCTSFFACGGWLICFLW